MREDHDIERQDFVVTTRIKPLNFLKHIMTSLDLYGRVAAGHGTADVPPIA